MRYVLEGRILPAFGSKPLDHIAPAEVRKWFDAYSRAAPDGANKGIALLRQIMNIAIARGYVEKNPTRGIRRNRRPKLTRFLSREEIARLHRALDRRPRAPPAALGRPPPISASASCRFLRVGSMEAGRSRTRAPVAAREYSPRLGQDIGP